MSTSGRVDTSTLGWVRDEIDESLEQARTALQGYAEDHEDITALRLFASNVHQVAGTLQMVELDGAAQLAQEIEALAAARIAGRVEEVDEKPLGELLGDGVDRLSACMRRLARGLPDRPIDNVAAINVLRGARHAEPLEPYSLLHPDLDVYPPRDVPAETVDGPAYAQRLRSLRRDYQSALLGWLRGEAPEDALGALDKAVAGLFDLARFQAAMQVWWVARAYLDVLAAAELVRNDPRKYPLAQLDQLIRKLIDDPTAGITRDGSAQLLRFMLYYIGTSEARSDAIDAVIRLFDLEALLGEMPDIPEPPETEALFGIRDRSIQSLRAVQEALDDYARSGRMDEALADSAGHLDSLADAAREFEVEELAALAASVRTLLFDRGAQPADDALMVAARALLFIEQSLEHAGEIAPDWRAEVTVMHEQVVEYTGSTPGMEAREVDATSLERHEFQRLMTAVGGQIEASLAEAERNLERFARDAGATDSLEAVAEALHQVHGAVRMLGQHDLCDLLERAISQVRAITGGEVFASDTLLDALAVTIGTTDACVKGMQQDAPYVEEMLGRAMRELDDAVAGKSGVDVDPAVALRQIHQFFDTWIDDSADYEAFRGLRRNLRDIGAVAHQCSASGLQRIAQEMTNLVDIVMDDPSFLSPEVADTLRRSLATLSELAAPLPSVPAGTALEARDDVRDEDQAEDQAEDLVRATFAEEARECLAAIAAGLAALVRDQEDRESLTEIRRAFHTIKGSGRMARARDIAELAWIVEDALNRVLDGRLAIAPPLLEFVDRARAALEQLLAQGLDSAADLQAWRQDAAALQREAAPGRSATGLPDGLAGGEPDPQTPGAAIADGGSEPARDPGRDPGAAKISNPPGEAGEPHRSVTAGAAPIADDQVLEIFSREALSHIATIRAAVDDCRRLGESRIGEPLRRAVHTLRGNARALHLVELSQAYDALDASLTARSHRASPLHTDDLPALEDLLVVTAKVLERLNQDRRFPDVVRQELVELARRLERIGRDPGQPARSGTRSNGGLAQVSALVRDGSGPERGPGAAGSVFDELAESDLARARPGAAVPEREALVDEELRGVFIDEALEILARFDAALGELKQNGFDEATGRALKRELHTLKGSARAARVDVIGDLSHAAESLLEQADRAGDAGADLPVLLEEVHDSLVSRLRRLEHGDPAAPDPALVRRLRDAVTRPAPAAGEPAALIPEDAPARPGAAAASAPAGRRDTVRIQSNVLDKLVNYAGEVSISRAQIEEQLGGLKGNLKELRANVARFSDQVRELDIQADSQIRSRLTEEQPAAPGHDFDPLEMDRYSRLQQLSRGLSESVDDLATIQAGLNRFAAQTEGVLSQQAMLSSELQDGLMSARMVPFDTLVPRLRHQARQTARELGKAVDFIVDGGELEVDRNMLGQLGEALEHLIRNALDHGIELPAARDAVGKPARGALRVECRQEGNEFLIVFSDDGAGLDVERIKARGVEAGLLDEDAELTDHEVIQLIVLSGFSTAPSLTQLSGRGVGLDVVNDAARRLGGSLSLHNRPGAGVSFELRLPLSLSITQALFVRCGEQRFAVPLGVVETVLKADPQQVEDASGRNGPLFRRDQRVYPLMDLAAALGLASGPPGARIPILLVRMGAREVAVRVDELLRTDEIVVKALGDHLGRVAGFGGATITGSGVVVLILDLAALWLAQERLPAFRPGTPVPEEAHAPRILVVDDSLTVRKVTGRSLGRHGMTVSMARDGVDALEQVAQIRPDLMLVDIEMPRMDGYELTTRIRADVETRDIPIIIITSRTSARHRDKAMELGANAYLTKPYREKDLLEEVNALLPQAAPPASGA